MNESLITFEYVALVLPFPFLLVYVLMWLWRGRDGGAYRTIAATFEPPAGLAPSEAALVLKESVSGSDITADIVELAVLGYLKITRIPSTVSIGRVLEKAEFRLEPLRLGSDIKNPVLKELHWHLFEGQKSVTLAELSERSHAFIQGILDDHYRRTVELGYFSKNPKLTRGLLLLFGCIVLIGFATYAIANGRMNALLVGGSILTAAVIVFFSVIMPARTHAGSRMRRYLLGLKHYIEIAEKDRSAFHNAPELIPAHFERLLPYAMVFGAEKKWAERFGDMYRDQAPAWYADSSPGGLSAAMLSGRMLEFSAAARAVTIGSIAAGGGSAHSGRFVAGGFGGGGEST